MVVQLNIRPYLLLQQDLRKKLNPKYLFASFIVLFMFISPVQYCFFDQKTYADGLTSENLPPVSIGNRQISLYLKVNPPIVTSTSALNAFMQFRLFDPSNNQTTQHVTYRIAVTSGTTSSSSEKPLLVDTFHSDIGLLTLHIEPTNGPIIILAEHDPILKSWLADSSGNILMRGPIFLHGGLFHFHVEILTIDNDATLFTPQQSPKFDASLSLGDLYQNNWNYQNQKYNTTVVSYYDKLNSVNFKPTNKLFTWSMPFDYNLSRIKQQPIFVHEEMRIPKSWKGFGDLTQFNATVNGKRLSGRSLAIDPFSFPDAMVVHYLVNKDDILKLAGNAAATGSITKSTTTNLMKFTLSPPSVTSPIATSSDLVSNTGGIHAAVSWSPNPIVPNTQSTLNISFYDPTGTTPLTNTNVKYNLIIYDKNNHVVITKQNLSAKNATDSEILYFPAKEIYHIVVAINGLLKAGQAPDFTRNGVATGYVVVPEFPGFLNTFLIMALTIGMLLLIRCRKTIFSF
ncbi:MAG TPA: hypothetical protein VEH06_17390 [Candidatus Bathyarchaeia archaeon]|nr:hypothetical protein [Candidatus Bathyarchaeia archaeon]